MLSYVWKDAEIGLTETILLVCLSFLGPESCAFSVPGPLGCTIPRGRLQQLTARWWASCFCPEFPRGSRPGGCREMAWWLQQPLCFLMWQVILLIHSSHPASKFCLELSLLPVVTYLLLSWFGWLPPHWPLWCFERAKHAPGSGPLPLFLLPVLLSPPGICMTCSFLTLLGLCSNVLPRHNLWRAPLFPIGHCFLLLWHWLTKGHICLKRARIRCPFVPIYILNA